MAMCGLWVAMFGYVWLWVAMCAKRSESNAGLPEKQKSKRNWPS